LVEDQCEAETGSALRKLAGLTLLARPGGSFGENRMGRSRDCSCNSMPTAESVKKIRLPPGRRSAFYRPVMLPPHEKVNRGLRSQANRRRISARMASFGMSPSVDGRAAQA
jgi:hypothetical protein